MLRLRTFIFSFMKFQTMYKLLLSLISIVLLITVVSFWFESDIQYARKCFTASYLKEQVGLVSLSDVMVHERKPKLGKTIFFHETSCSNGIIQLNAR